MRALRDTDQEYLSDLLIGQFIDDLLYTKRFDKSLYVSKLFLKNHRVHPFSSYALIQANRALGLIFLNQGQKRLSKRRKSILLHSSDIIHVVSIGEGSPCSAAAASMHHAGHNVFQGSAELRRSKDASLLDIESGTEARGEFVSETHFACLDKYGDPDQFE